MGCSSSRSSKKRGSESIQPSNSFQNMVISCLNRQDLELLTILMRTGRIGGTTRISGTTIGHYWLANGLNFSTEDYIAVIKFLRDHKLFCSTAVRMNMRFSGDDDELVVEFSSSDTGTTEKYMIFGTLQAGEFMLRLLTEIIGSTSCHMICASSTVKKRIINSLKQGITLLNPELMAGLDELENLKISV